MAIKTSTGLRNKLLVTGSFKSMFDLGFIKIYSGTPPTLADDAPTGTLLCTISVTGGGTGLTMGSAAVSGVLSKPATVWSGPIVATNTATYYRLITSTDGGASSPSDARVQGTVGTVGADLNLSTVALVTNASTSAQTIDYFDIALPTL